MVYRQITCFLILIPFIGACRAQTKPFSWPEGNYQQQNLENRSKGFENWQKVNDSLYQGESFVVSIEGDTLFSEKMLITVEKEAVFFIAEVPNQNEGKPVRFKLVTYKDGEYSFENPEHDFPQRIIYRFAKNKLHAAVESADRKKQIDFNFIKTK